MLIATSLAKLKLTQDLPEDLGAVTIPACDVTWSPCHDAVSQLLLNPVNNDEKKLHRLGNYWSNPGFKLKNTVM